MSRIDPRGTSARAHARLTLSRLVSRAILGLAVVALGAHAAQALVPGQVNYQGLLLDDQGTPVTGPVDMVFRLYTTETAGTVQWTESHTDVDVLDGVYEVALGSLVPLSPSLLAGGAVYLEVEVEAEILTPRQRLLAVPYALLAEDVNDVGGVPSEVISQVYEHFSFDGQAPPNDDPLEGLSDVDGDGIANFIDPDNDNDGIQDEAELNAGTNVNLVTPILGNLAPAQARSCVPTSVDVTGGNFDPDLTFDIGSQSPTPQNVSPTSFDVLVGPQAAGTVTATVSNPNGEQASQSFEFFDLQPSISTISPIAGFSDEQTLVHFEGNNFEPGMTVQFGSQNLAPMNPTSTSFDVLAGPQSPGNVTITVTNTCGEQAFSTFGFIDGGIKRVFVSSVIYDGNFGGLAGADATCNQLAANAGLSGTFGAWLSDGTQSPDTRFARTGNPYMLIDDTVIAADWTDLTDGTIQAPIGVTELGGSNSGIVFTNVSPDGTAKSSSGAASCNGWTSDATTYNGGSTIHVGAGWTDLTFGNCNLGRLYCFEQ